MSQKNVKSILHPKPLKKLSKAIITPKSKYYKQKFRNCWLSEEFSPWLIRNPNNPERPYCIYCDRKLEGGIAHLRRHAKCSMHKKKETTTTFNNIPGNLELSQNKAEINPLQIAEVYHEDQFKLRCQTNSQPTHVNHQQVQVHMKTKTIAPLHHTNLDSDQIYSGSTLQIHEHHSNSADGNTVESQAQSNVTLEIKQLTDMSNIECINDQHSLILPHGTIVAAVPSTTDVNLYSSMSHQVK